MTQKPRSSANLLQLLPTKWAIVVVVGLILYAVAQPWANRTFGWRLPSLSGNNNQVASSKEDASKGKADKARKVESQSDQTERSEDKTVAPKGTGENKSAPPKTPKDVDLGGDSSSTSKESTAQPKQSSQPKKDTAKPPTGTESKSSEPKANTADKKFGFLTDLGRNRFESPAGLIYGPGSEEGHRLKHVERHTEDQPDRPSKHGVFDGGMETALRKIDDGYLRASKGAKGTTKRNEEGKTVYEANFDKPIGFVGGRDGKRSGNPPAKRVRIVVDGKNVITAFPF